MADHDIDLRHADENRKPEIRPLLTSGTGRTMSVGVFLGIAAASTDADLVARTREAVRATR